ncbi:MAG TPA: GNAT family N-acetyltransferase [Pyrinomonadaceae bacterium]|nr:GNAT family N-acetyltransferase [Pyrinomonadaceae bacterium]
MDSQKKEIGVITLRPVTDEDREFLISVYAAGRASELEMVPWDDAMKRTFIEHQYIAQDEHYRSYYSGATHDVILAGGEPVGRLYLDRTEKQIAILDIGVLPAFRKRGIATEIVRRLQGEATTRAKSVCIYIEAFNPADKLFGELGFQMIEDDGGLRRFEWQADTLES